MLNFNKFRISLITILIFFAISISSLISGTIYTNKDKESKENNQSDQLQAKTYRGVFDVQKNTVSNIDFYTTNYGIFGFDIARQRGGGYWPRGSQNQYIFAGGFWFGAQKYRKNIGDTVSLVTLSYNPWSGKGWFVPGRINIGGPFSTAYPDVDLVDQNDPLLYRTYFSIDFKTATGEPIDPEHKYNWPIWDASKNVEDTLKNKRYFGYYIPQTELRNTTQFSKGPAFISGEDIFSTYKDTDLNYYEGGVATRRERGYPMRLQVEQMIYSWGFGDYRDFIFLKYEITNYSRDTLFNCWLAPVMDVDIARATSSGFGAGNDRVKFYDCYGGDTLNMAVQWTNTDRNEYGYGFGYLGFDFLESPAVVKYYDTTYKEIKDSQGNVIGIDTILTRRLWDPVKDGPDAPRDNFVRKDSAFYANSSQLGLVTFNNWPIEQDKQTDDERYAFMSAGIRQGDDGPGDKRFMMATGPFHMRPTDTVRVVVGVILANTAKGGEADGTCEDLQELVRKNKFAQTVYDNNFRAPVAPERSIITNSNRRQIITGINNGNIIKWDSTAEMSVDIDEKGLDFMGYLIYRARRTDLDTFDVNNISGTAQYPGGKGPFGWKLVGGYSLRPAFYKSDYRAGGFKDDLSYPLIDQLEIIGPYIDKNGKILDSMALQVMRVGLGCNVQRTQNTNIPVLVSIDTSYFYAPWGNYYFDLVKRDPNLTVDPDGRIYRVVNGQKFALNYDPNFKNEIFDSALVGVAYFNKSLIKFNPLFYQRKTLQRSLSYLDNLFKVFPDGIVGDTVIRYDEKLKKFDTIRVTTDSIYMQSTMRAANISGIDTYVIDVWVPRNWQANLRDTTFMKELSDSLYKFIQASSIRLEIADLQQREEVRKNVIAPWMRWITNNRTFIDIGDDNFDGYISENQDPAKTERLLNNIEYYYKIIAYDEGDFLQPTNSKKNTGSEGLPNFAISIPTAAPVGNYPEIKVVYVDSTKMGGLYNFRFFGIDNDRLMQKFEGDSLVLTFEPFWFESSYKFTKEGQDGKFGLYRSRMILKSQRTGDTLYNGFALLEDQPCNFSYFNLFSENAASTILADTLVRDTITGRIIDFGTPFAKGKITRSGRYYSGDFTYPGYCYTDEWTRDAYGIFGFSFDFTVSQFAGRYRGDSTTIEQPYGQGVTANTPVNFVNDPATLVVSVNPDMVMTTQPVDFDFKTRSLIYGSFNNGPAVYEVEFLPGGTETMELFYRQNNSKNTFNVPYLNVRVRNLTEFKRLSEKGDSVTVRYPVDVPHMNIEPVLPVTKPSLNLGSSTLNAAYNALWSKKRAYPDPRNLPYYGVNTNEFIGKFNIHSYGYVSNSTIRRGNNTAAQVLNQFARWGDPRFNDVSKTTTEEIFTGSQGKYLMTGISVDGVDTVDFVNIINIAGVQFALDFANKGSRFVTTRGTEWQPKQGYNIWQAKDFKPGDKIYLRTTGGAQGFPLPNAKVVAVVSKSTPPNNEYTDEMMDRINVVPNPYFLTHQGVRSPYDNKIYFTKLPKVCTIEIYTLAGDLVKTINHDEFNNDGELDRNSVQVWDLLSKNESRVQSQAFIAVITTPNGAKTVKNFSVVVGGFRLLEE